MIGRRDVFGRLSHFIYNPIRYFAQAALGRVAPVATFADGLLNVRMIDATRRSLDERRERTISEVLADSTLGDHSRTPR